MKTIKDLFTLNTVKPAVAAGLMVAAASSQAAIDTASITASLTEAATVVGVIGAAVLGVVVVIKTFKFIRSSF